MKTGNFAGLHFTSISLNECTEVKTWLTVLHRK